MCPVPIPHKEKAPKTIGWPALRITKTEVGNYFNGKPQNIGVILGISNLADVDLDCAEAVKAADLFLPATDFEFGRASRARSHRFYVLSEGVPTRKFHDPVKTESTLLELRCLKGDGEIGLQTVVPPSTHPSGEAVRFSRHGKPAKVAAEDLNECAAKLAAVAALARAWPAEGAGRNEAFLALAGTLAHGGAAQELAVQVAQGVYRVLWGTGANLKQAETEVKATYGKAATSATTGFPRLAEFIPQTVIRHAMAWLGVTATSGWQDFPFTDLGNAERFVARHGDDVLWCDPWRSWVTWDGKRWARDAHRRILGLAQETVRSVYAAAAAMPDPDQRKTLVDNARRCESRQKLEAMLAMACPMVAATPEQFDTDNWLLNVANGTLDLRTGKLREHRRDDLLSKLAPVEYDADAKCPRWQRFLGRSLRTPSGSCCFHQAGGGLQPHSRHPRGVFLSPVWSGPERKRHFSEDHPSRAGGVCRHR